MKCSVMVEHTPELLYFLVLLCSVRAHEGAKENRKIIFRHISTRIIFLRMRKLLIPQILLFFLFKVESLPYGS